MSMKVLSCNLEASGDTAPMGMVDSLRFLKAALDQVEEPNGYWHKSSASAVAVLSKWDERQKELDTDEVRVA